MNNEPDAPYARALSEHIRKCLLQYDEGAIFVTELILAVHVELENYMAEVVAEDLALRKHYDETVIVSN
jgi:hypothetical protein